MPYPGFPTFPKYPSASPVSLDEAVLQGRGTLVAPTTDTGYRTYGSGGRLFLPAATNYVTNPSFETDTDANGLADGCSNISYSGNATITTSRVTGRLGGYAQRVVRGGTSGYALLAYTGANSSVSPGDVLTVSAYIKAALSLSGGAKVGMYLVFADNAGANKGGAVSVDITACADWTRFAVTGTAPAGTEKFSFRVGGGADPALASGDSFTIDIDDACLTKSSVLTPYFDGTYPDCAWTGTANASTSTRTASGLYYASPWTTVPWAGTIAGRGVPLGANTAYSTEDLAGLYATTTAKAVLGHKGGKRNMNVGTEATSAATFAENSVNVSVGRWDAAGTYLNFNGTDATAGAAPTNIGAAIDRLYIGGAGPYYEGPKIFSPYRKSNAWTAAIQANSGAAYNDLMGLWEYFMEPGDLLIPLQSNSNAYLKASGPQRSTYDYVYTGADATTDTGWESYA